MPVLTRCRGKTPEGEAMKASPNPKKLKQAARRLKEAKKKAETQKNTGKAKKEEKVDTGKAKKEEKVDTGKAKKEEKVEPTLKTPSPKPILKKDDASSTTKTKRRTKRRLSFVEPHQCIPIEAENKPGDKKNKDMATGQAMSEDEAERIIKEMSKPSAEAAGHSDSESTCDDASSNSSSSSEDKDGSGDEDEATESEGEVSEEQSEDSSDSEAEQVQEDEGSSDEETVDGSDTEEEEEAEDAKKGAMAKKAQSEAEESDSDSSDESCGEPEVTKKIAATKTPEVNKQDEPKKNYKKKAGQEEKNTKKSSKKEDKKEKKEKASAAKTTEDEKKQKTKKTKESKTKPTEEPCLKIEDQKDQEKKRGRGKDDGKSKEKVTSKRSKDKGDQNETGGHDASKLAVVEANLAKTAAPTSEEAKGSSSSSSSTEDKINSSTHHTEYLRYRRWIRNGKRFPTVLGSRLTTEEGRASLFVDWVKCGGDVDSIICKHEQSLTESRSSQVKYGFRSERWLNEKYGEEKAKRIVGRKTNLGLLIPDPEEPEDNLYFCLIDIDLKNINELKRVTSLEAKGQVSAEMVKAFTEAGGVLDGSALKGDMSVKEGMSKAVSFMGAVGKTGQAQGTGKAARRNGKANKGNSDSAPAKEVKAETPQSKAKTLITKVLKDANTCRDLAFRLKPLEMSDQLINQLKALQSGLEKQARALQDLINQDKNKMKHYTPVMEEIANLNQLAKNKVELGKALLRAAEKATKGSEEKAKEPENGTGSTDKNNKKRKKAS